MEVMVRRRWPIGAVAVLALAGCERRQPFYVAAALDRDEIHGAQVVSREVTAANGIDRRKFAVRALPDTGDVAADVVLDSVRAWGEDSTVLAALGHSNRRSGTEGVAAMTAARLPHILTRVMPPAATVADSFRFQLAPTVEAEADYLVQQATKLGGPLIISAIYPEDPAGAAIFHALRSRLESAGLHLAFQGSYRSGVHEAQLIDVAVRSADPEPSLIYWLGGAGELARVMATLKTRAPTALILASTAVEVGELYFNPENVFTGVRFVRMAILEAPDPRVQEYRLRYYSWAGRHSTSVAAVAYDGASLIVAALREGVRTRAQLRDYLASIGRSRPAFNGITGPIAFDDQGRSPRRFSVAEVVPNGVRPVAEDP